MDIESGILFCKLNGAYQSFDRSYDGMLKEYYPEYFDCMKALYEKGKPLRGLIFIDGTYSLDMETVTTLFTNYSTCFVLVTCMSPAERDVASGGGKNIEKSLAFEDASLMRYMGRLFTWLGVSLSPSSPPSPGGQTNRRRGKLVVYNSTSFRSLKSWLREKKDLINLVWSVQHLKCLLDS